MGAYKYYVLANNHRFCLLTRVSKHLISLFLTLSFLPSYPSIKRPFIFQSNYIALDTASSPSDTAAVKTDETNYKNSTLSLLGSPPGIGGTVTDAYCYGSADGTIDYTITGSDFPFTYNWSNGKSGKVLGSYWNIISINNPGTALNNYQVQVDLPYSTGMKPDYSDLIFSDTTNTSLYHFWIESKTTSNAIVWVKVPVIPSGASAMRVSYGDPTATSLSNGVLTFDYFDDFNDGDISDWTQDCQNLSEPDETCSMTLDANTIKLTSYSHCGGPTKNGVITGAKKNITLPAGQYKQDVSSQIYICLHDACADSTRVGTFSYYDGIYINGFYWYLQQKGSCGCIISTWFEIRSDPFTSSGLSKEVKLEGEILDCGNGYVRQDNYRIRKFSNTGPSIIVGPSDHLHLSNLNQGDYTINVTNNIGVSNFKTFTINQPNLPVAINGSNCGTGTIDLSVNGTYTSYNWYSSSSGGSSFLSSSTYTTPVITNTQNYYVSGVGNNNCETNLRTMVSATVLPLPSPPIASDSSRCGTGAIDLKASGSPLSYNWYTSSTGGSSIANSDILNLPSVSTNTSYYVSAIDANSCESARTTVNAIIDPLSTGTLIGADTLLPNSNTNPITVNTKTGNITRWEKSNNINFLGITTLSSVGNSISDYGLQTTTYYRAAVKSGTCPSVYTNPIEIRINQPHICFPDTVYMYSDQILNSTTSVLTNDVDSSGDALSVQSKLNYKTYQGGTITFNSDGSYQYNPASKYIGIDTIQYTACDLYESSVSYCRKSYLCIVIEDNRLANGGIIVYPTISPNGDYLNDTWIIDGIEKYPNNKISILDRWGNIVFESQGYSSEEEKVWKGNSNTAGIIGHRELQDGTYFYIIELGNNTKSIKGYVVLKR